MSIIVTGGAGFIGSNFILEWFEENNEEVINIDCTNYASNLENLNSLVDNRNYTFIKADINDRQKFQDTLTEYSPRAVINFAAETHVDRSIENPDPFIHSNISGVHNLLEATRKYLGTNNNRINNFRFLQISTDEVYGSLGYNQSPASEKNLIKPNSPYSASKASADHLVRAYNKTFGINTIITRCSNNFGPRQDSEKLVPKIIEKAIQRDPIPIYGSGDNIRDWLFVSDHCQAIRLVLENGQSGQTYNIGGDCEKTNLEIATIICNQLDILRPLQDETNYSSFITMVKDRPGHDFRYAIDSSKIRSALNWKPKHSFINGLSKTINWYIQNY